MEANLLIDAIGWIGAVAVLVAYALVSAERLESSSTAYQLLNLVGGSLLIVNTVYYGAYPSTILNLFWVGVAVHALVRYRRGSAAAG